MPWVKVWDLVRKEAVVAGEKAGFGTLLNGDAEGDVEE